MKKLLAILLTALFLLTAVSALAEEQTTLTMWCIATESDANRPGYEAAIAEFEAAHPDVKIEWEAFENESYKTKIKAAMSSGEELPDIFFTWVWRLPGRLRGHGHCGLPGRLLSGAYADELPRS